MPTASKKVINGWAMYDWANSSYALVVTSTIFPTYYSAVAPEHIELFGRSFGRAAMASYAISLSYLIIAFLSPILSSIADYKGNKKSFMKFFCYMGSLACICLVFMDKHHVLLGLFFSVIASVGFSGSIVFYNAYLPEIAAEEDQDRVSAKGFALGYVGSVLLMIACLAVIECNDNLHWGLGAWPARLSFPAVGFWWAGFAQLTFRILPPSKASEQHPEHSILTNGFYELGKVWNQLVHYPTLKRYLRSFFFYNMGVQTVMMMATYFASEELKLPDASLIMSILIIQLVAIGGAYLFSLLSARTGNIFVLGVLIVIWIGICVFAYYTRTPMEFYILAFFVGMVMGGIQSMSRSTYSKLLPETKDTASYFSFYDVCDKIGTVIGTASFGYVAESVGGMRNSVLALMGYFIIGFVLLLFVRVTPKTQTYATVHA
ncbi:MFS transporter [Dinghuibacter silviterrae]|uniref:UMF1 family MFS transporter n=1 Tax=Dinghuibacter silviterrae TaxID=1539049 RepID=A0A4R8DQS3_9BACT|nr:MFS transporter [Dinghuibacter silviterrae]TDX00156.1 UMF1 family MFS transporter [Dinghuibacter silviterrae]